MSPAFSGSLSTKRKADLVEIAQQLKLDADAKISDLVKSIQTHLDENEATLSKSPTFQGLYSHSRKPRASTGPTETPVSDAKAQVASVAHKGRKSVNKALDKVVDAASVPLPDSPVARVQEAASNAANSLQVALRPQSQTSKDLVQRFNEISGQVVKFTGKGQDRVDVVVARLRDHLSDPDNLIVASLGIELLFLLFRTVQFYEHTIFFPPAGGPTGSINSLLHSLFFWAPSFQLNLRYPELRFRRVSWGYSFFSEATPALTWWFFTTVLPPLSLSTVVSFSSHNTHARAPAHSQGSRHSRAHAPKPTVDPLSFSIFRLAIFLFTLTTAAPSAIVDALELSGNLQARALGAGVLVALMLADRLG